MSGIVDQILREAENELLEKEANDGNGAPEQVSNQEQGGGDILTTAQAFLQKIEQFKAALSQGVAENVDQQIPEDQMQDQQQLIDPNTSQVPAGNNAVVISRPDGTQIKLASLQKLASLRGANLFKEV